MSRTVTHQSRIVTRRPAAGKPRFIWWRAHHGLPFHPKWRAVARRAKVSSSEAFHVVMCLLDAASRGSPRGSVDAFKVIDCCGATDLEESAVEAVLEALRGIGWISGHMIAEWDERQPQREDPGAAERKQRQREAEESSCHDMSRTVTQTSAPEIDRDIITSTELGSAREEAVGRGSEEKQTVAEFRQQQRMKRVAL